MPATQLRNMDPKRFAMMKMENGGHSWPLKLHLDYNFLSKLHRMSVLPRCDTGDCIDPVLFLLSAQETSLCFSTATTDLPMTGPVPHDVCTVLLVRWHHTKRDTRVIQD